MRREQRHQELNQHEFKRTQLVGRQRIQAFRQRRQETGKHMADAAIAGNPSGTRQRRRKEPPFDRRTRHTHHEGAEIRGENQRGVLMRRQIDEVVQRQRLASAGGVQRRRPVEVQYE